MLMSYSIDYMGFVVIANMKHSSRCENNATIGSILLCLTPISDSRILYLAHVIVLRGYVGTLVAPIIGTVDVQEADVVLQYTSVLLVPCTTTVAELFHMVVGMGMVGWVCIVVDAVAAMGCMCCLRILVSSA